MDLALYTTARGAMLAYLAGWGSWWGMPEESRRVAARGAWTLGAALLAVHLLLAMHAAHGWSHAAAYEATAQRTGELFGLHWGGGVYFNYALTLLWLADVAWQHLDWPSYEARPWLLGAAWHGYFLLMLLNGALLFANPLGRGIFLSGAVLILLSALLLRWRRVTPFSPPAQ